MSDGITVSRDHRRVVIPLLNALGAMGRHDEARRLQRGFEARGWQLTQADVADVLARLSIAQQQALPIETTSPATGRADDEARGSLDEPIMGGPTLVELYRPFLEAIPSWRELLTATNRLMSAHSWTELCEAAREVFCDVLGFDDDRVSLTHRLRGRSTIADFKQIGSFAGFRVCLVRLTRSLSDTRWSNMSEHYRPCFRLVPRALLISYEPGAGAIRLVFRQRHGRSDTRPRYRCIVGPWFLRDSQENLLTVCRRLDLCRPDFDDDAETYGRRVQAALECEVGALAKDWASGPLPERGRVPGLAMDAATAELMRSFLAPGEWRWGLRGHLGNLFPVPLRFGETWLDLAAVEPVGEPESADACWRGAHSRVQYLELSFVLRNWDDLEPRESFEIKASLLVPDSQGWFWLEGRPYRYLPEVGADGRLLSRTGMPAWVDQLKADDDDDDDDAPEIYPLYSAEGAVIDAVVGRAVERRLWHLVRRLRRIARDSVDAGRLRAKMLATVPPGEALPLLTPAMARALLTPVDVARPLLDLSDVASSRAQFVSNPPAWACPDVSADLQPDRWAVVSGARVHPTGALAVPVRLGGALRLVASGASAFDVNPRLGAEHAGDRSWWIHPRLAAFSHLNAGRLQEAARVASAGVRIEAKGVSAPTVRHAQLAPWLRPSRTVLRTCVDVPKVGHVDVEPSLLVGEGDRLLPGAAWLQVPGRHLAHDHDDTRSHLGSVVADLLGGAVSGALVERLPWDCPAVVRSAAVTAVERLGVTMGWRAWIEVEAVPESTVSAVTTSGDVVPVEAGWHPEDLPYATDGEVFEVVVPSSVGAELCFSGVDGEPVLVRQLDAITVLPPTVPVRDRAAVGAVDRMPRPGVRSTGEPWSVTRLRWLSEGAPIEWWNTLGSGRLHRELLAWCAGVGDLPAGIECAAVAEVPITSKPHLVGKVLSEVRWLASCECGRLTGAGLLGASCPECGGLVGPKETLARVHECVLPTPVLHPWARELAAALLGLVPDELEHLLTRHGPTPVLEACKSALSAPCANALTRLDLPPKHPRALDGQVRRRLGQMVELFTACGADAELYNALVVERVGVPSLDLLKVGNTLGELEPTGSRLMAAYARLHGACWAVQQAAQLKVEPLLATAQVHLQACVDAVFGAADTEGSDTLAGLMRATSPWSRDARPPVKASVRHWRSLPGSKEWWQQRAARAQVVEHHAMDLLSLVWSMPGLGDAARREACRALASDLLDEQRDPRGLLTLLHEERGRPTQLPSEWSEAEETLVERLRGALGDQALPVVVRVLGGWWMGEPSPACPSGAVWLPPGERGPQGFRRRVPPLSHALWRSWPGIRAVRPELGLACLFGLEPVEFPVQVLDDGEPDDADQADEVVRIEVSGGPVPEKQEESAAPPEAATAARSAPEAPTAPSTTEAPREDIRVVSATLRAWLEER